MNRGAFILLLIVFFNAKNTYAQAPIPKAKVDFDGYEALIKQVKQHRKTRLVNLETFLKLSKQEGAVILDTRSGETYNRKHIAGALHLDFSDFTEDNLAGIIPSIHTKVLIYCNGNFKEATDKSTRLKNPANRLALNIPTYISLYGYGYANVYELSELVNNNDERLQYEGSDMDPDEPSATGAVIMTKR